MRWSRWLVPLFLLPALVSCQEQAPRKQEVSTQAPPQANMASKEKLQEASGEVAPLSPSDPKSVRWLVILASFPVSKNQSASSLPAEWSKVLPESVETFPGFPRVAQGEELLALRTGYGALLGGICERRGAAQAAVEALRAEGLEAYIKRAELSSPDACPLTNSRWALGNDLVKVIEAGNPNSTEEVERLLKAGASANHEASHGSPLNLAAYNNDLEIVRLLVAAGARLNRPHRAPQEESTLELALRSPHGDPLEMVRFLVTHGADVDAETEGAEADPGSSPQLAAIRRCHPRALQFLRSKSKKRLTAVSPGEVCRDEHPPEVPESDRAEVLRLLSEP